MPPSHDPDRTDSVERKLGLLAAAYGAGHRDLAMSLAESIKDTLRFERTAAVEPGTPLHSPHDDFGRVGDLPAAWAGWARGWSFFKAISLFETVGLAAPSSRSRSGSASSPTRRPISRARSASRGSGPTRG